MADKKLNKCTCKEQNWPEIECPYARIVKGYSAFCRCCPFCQTKCKQNILDAISISNMKKENDTTSG